MSIVLNVLPATESSTSTRHLLGKSPILVAGIDASNNKSGFVSPVLDAGCYIELAGGRLQCVEPNWENYFLPINNRVETRWLSRLCVPLSTYLQPDTRNLNRMIDVNYHPVLEARRSNIHHRPIGLGVQGLADAFMALRMPFDSQAAKHPDLQEKTTMGSELRACSLSRPKFLELALRVVQLLDHSDFQLLSPIPIVMLSTIILDILIFRGEERAPRNGVFPSLWDSL